MIWRLPKLKADNEIESLVSREFAFLLNNWVLLGMMVFVLVATTFPLLSQWMRGEEVTVGSGLLQQVDGSARHRPSVLGRIWGPWLPGAKATGSKLARALAFLGRRRSRGCRTSTHLRSPCRLSAPVVEPTEIYDTNTGKPCWHGWQRSRPWFPLRPVHSCSQASGQEFWRGMRVRMRKGEGAGYGAGAARLERSPALRWLHRSHRHRVHVRRLHRRRL